MLVQSKSDDMHTQVGLPYPKEENIRKLFQTFRQRRLN